MSLTVSKIPPKDSGLSAWSRRDKKALMHRLPDTTKKPLIDYDKLKQLIEINGLKEHDGSATTEEAHRQFMANYSSIFIQPEPKKGIPIHSIERSHQKETRGSNASKSVAGKTKPEDQTQTKKQYEVDSITHDIRDYLPLLHKQRKSENPEAVKMERIKTLRKILRKLPFERTAVENDQVYNVMKYFPCLADQCPSNVLKELCVMAHLDSWKEDNVTIFGNSGWHMVLKGKVLPNTYPYCLTRGQANETDLPCPTPDPPFDIEELNIGDSFGTLEKVEGREPNSRILSVKTVEPNCEFLKISCADYSRVIEQIHQRDQTEKVNLLQECKTFNLWSRQPLIKIASQLEWVNFPANTVLVSEGYTVPFVGIIKSGECHVLRQVQVLNTLPNGKQVEKSKQVVMGKLGSSESFGEVSCVSNEAISCSIITSTAVQLGVIESEKLAGLDDTTRQLLLQSSEPTFGKLTQEDVHEEYVKQELKREWNEFKHNVVIESINSKGIRPGYGKWSK